MKDLANKFAMVEFKLETVSPLITQAQISDCLYDVLPPKSKARIAIHEYKKYDQLNKEVLEKHYKEIESKFKGM